MLTGNTESGITVTYDDAANEIDFTVASQTDQNFTNADHTKLNGIETGATADQTAAQILALIKTVDGTGSGLDADLLDGQTGSYYTGGKGQAQNYVASSSSTSNRGNYGAGVWAYSGYSTGTNRPFTYDSTLQVMPTASMGFELSTDWHSSKGQLVIRSLRDCCEGWSDYSTIWTSANFANNSTNWNTAYGWGNHASAGYVTSSGNTIIGTDSDINTSGATVVDQLNMTDGVIQSHSTRTLTLANLGYTGATNANYITNNNQLTNGAGYVTSSGNTVIGTDSDINTSGAAVLDQLVMTDGVITSHSTRNLTLANLGYTGATNANYITNNNQLTNGAGYVTSNTQLSTEQVQDAVGAMLTGNTESGITVTYDDTNNEIDFTVASQTDQNFTNADHTKLNGIATGAEVNVQSNWSATSGDALILNKPTIPSGNAVIDWTVSQGSGTDIHSDNYTNTTYSAGSSITLSGTTFSHSDTSTQASSANSGRTYIQSINLDGQGHVTGLSTATETVVNTDTNTTYSAGRGLDLSGTQFLLETDLRDSISHIGYDSNDYVQWSNNSYFRSVVSGSERFRVNTSGIDVTGTATANAFRTDTGNTDYNVISRNSTSTTLWVQAAQSGSIQGIASFRYGSATVNQGTEVCAIRRNSSYFINTKLGVGTNSPSVTLDVDGPIKHKVYTVSTLPSASPAGQRAFVSDAYYDLASSHGSAFPGGGSYTIPCYSDGSNWRAG
jgi:hypothetical protein